MKRLNRVFPGGVTVFLQNPEQIDCVIVVDVTNSIGPNDPIKQCLIRDIPHQKVTYEYLDDRHTQILRAVQVNGTFVCRGAFFFSRVKLRWVLNTFSSEDCTRCLKAQVSQNTKHPINRQRAKKESQRQLRERRKHKSVGYGHNAESREQH